MQKFAVFIVVGMSLIMCAALYVVFMDGTRLDPFNESTPWYAKKVCIDGHEFIFSQHGGAVQVFENTEQGLRAKICPQGDNYGRVY